MLHLVVVAVHVNDLEASDPPGVLDVDAQAREFLLERRQGDRVHELSGVVPCHRGRLLIEAKIPYGRLFQIVPSMQIGSTIDSPAGTTVSYDGAMEYRGADIAPDALFLLTVVGSVSAQLIAHWVIETFGESAQSVTINRRQIDLDDEGYVRRVIQEELKVER